MKAYKLFKRRKDGTLGPLFINTSQRVPVGEWLEAESHPTKGYAFRPGWHCTVEMCAPHIAKEPKSGEERVWCAVEVKGIEEFERPPTQGGMWYLASKMKVLEVIG